MKKRKAKNSQKSGPPHSAAYRTTLIELLRKFFRQPDSALSPIVKKSLLSLMLVLLFAGVVSYKINLFSRLPYFDPANGQGFFWTESAFHYRHFLMIAHGGTIPAVDYEIQYPEGLDTVRYITPVMEHVAGFIYRWSFSNMPPHLFAAYFSIIFSTLSVLVIFLTAKVAWRSNTIAFLCALIYGFAPASLARSAGGGYIREDFALPFIFSGFACFLYCLRQDRSLVAALGSCLLVIALAAWHVTQLYLSLFAAALAVAYFLGREKDLPHRSMLVFVAFMLAASFLIPVLRAKYFMVSPALMLSYALAALTWIGLRKDNSRRTAPLLAGLVIIGFLTASLVIQGYLGTYSHVYSLLFYKLKFLGILPEDPGRLPFEAKAMWTSAFVSPKLIELPIMLAASLIFGPIGAGIIFFNMLKKEADGAELTIAFLTAGMFFLFLLIHRMSVFAVFFMALSIGALSRIEKGRFKYALYGGVGAALAIQIILLPRIGLMVFRPNQKDVNSLISFINTQAQTDRAVLTTFELGPSIAAYTGHPVTLHSKFESQLLRDKVKQVYTAFYQSENQFYELCRRLNVGLVVYQVNMVLNSGPGSIRYLADAIPLKTDSAAFLFHFLPDRLRHFSLVYQNSTYRVYRVAAQAPPAAPPIEYEPVYDLEIFADKKDLAAFIDDAVLKAGIARLGQPETHLEAGDRFFASGDYKTAARQYESAWMLDRTNKRAAWSLGRALSIAGDVNGSQKILAMAAAMDPDYDVSALNIAEADALILLGREALDRKQFIKSEMLFQKALEDQPGSEEACFGLGLALWRNNKGAAAESAFQKVVSINPENHQAFEYLGKIYAARDDLVNAVASVKKSLELNPSQPELEKIYDLLQNRLADKKDAAEKFEYYFKSGMLKSKNGELQEALDMFLKASELKKNAPLMYNMALVSHRMHKDDDAAAYLKESLAINPTDIKSKSLLKYILGRRINVVIGDAESKTD